MKASAFALFMTTDRARKTRSNASLSLTGSCNSKSAISMLRNTTSDSRRDLELRSRFGFLKKSVKKWFSLENYAGGNLRLEEHLLQNSAIFEVFEGLKGVGARQDVLELEG